MTQRKLDPAEIRLARTARVAISALADDTSPPGTTGWSAVHSHLAAVVVNETNNGESYVPPKPEVVIDDQWTAAYPRRWVMGRDRGNEVWHGPYKIFGVCDDRCTHRYVTVAQDGGPVRWKFCRPATPAEIEMVEQPAPAGPEIGEGYRVAKEADVGRHDVEYWALTGVGWKPRGQAGLPLMKQYRYRVPVDRVPTDEDARSHPTVIGITDGKLERVVLYGVKPDSGQAYRFVGLNAQGLWCVNEAARFPYPGELD